MLGLGVSPRETPRRHPAAKLPIVCTSLPSNRGVEYGRKVGIGAESQDIGETSVVVQGVVGFIWELGMEERKRWV